MEETVDYRAIAMSVKGYFVSIGLSLMDAAERLGTNQPALSAMLSGRKITKRTALLLSSAFPFNVDFLTDGKGTLLNESATIKDTPAPRQDPGRLDISEETAKSNPLSGLIYKYMAGGCIEDRDGKSFVSIPLSSVLELTWHLAQENGKLSEENRRLRQALEAATDGGFHPVSGLAPDDGQDAE